MRVIAGYAKGIRLLPPEGMGTRPTLDRIKEAMFNIIQHHTENAIVLDMFTGTGSLGLEALSRGASKCVLVEKNESTFKLLKENVKKLKGEDKCLCLNKDAYEALNYLAQNEISFDLIFIDPPYLKDMIPKAIDQIHKIRLLKPEGIIITKVDSSEDIYAGNDIIKLLETRKYGNTTVCFYKM